MAKHTFIQVEIYCQEVFVGALAALCQGGARADLIEGLATRIRRMHVLMVRILLSGLRTEVKRIVVLGLLVIFGFFCEAQAQSSATKVIKIEIDGKEVKKNYKVFFLSNDRRIEAEKTSTGFIVPNKLKKQENLEVLITFGKYELWFPEIHISKFKTDWVIGVDNEPFSEEYVRPQEVHNAKRAYYIKFQGIGLDTRLIFTEWKNR